MPREPKVTVTKSSKHKQFVKTIICVVFRTDHRHTFHHTHHPLSTHLPPQRFRKRVLSMDRRRKKKRKKKKTSIPPSDVTPTIHEVDEEEAESETEGRCQSATPTEPSEDLPQVISCHWMSSVRPVAVFAIFCVYGILWNIEIEIKYKAIDL